MASNSEKARAVVLLSGGMDSSVCAALAAREYDTSALHISYGQRTEERERRAFISICDTLEIESRLMVKNDALRVIGGSALTDNKIMTRSRFGYLNGLTTTRLLGGSGCSPTHSGVWHSIGRSSWRASPKRT